MRLDEALADVKPQAQPRNRTAWCFVASPESLEQLGHVRGRNPATPVHHSDFVLRAVLGKLDRDLVLVPAILGSIRDQVPQYLLEASGVQQYRGWSHPRLEPDRMTGRQRGQTLDGVVH